MIKAEYIDHMGDDLRVANAARVSFAKESEWDETCSCGIKRNRSSDDNWPGCGADQRTCPSRVNMSLAPRDARLISYLARHDHFTPFTHCMITLRETIPIFVARQRFKHVVGFTYNEVSRRYVDDEPEFYTPETWRKRAENVKQGSGDDIDGSDDNTLAVWYHHLKNDMVHIYKEMLNLGVAPEQARMVLPQSMLTSYYVTGSLAAFARAYKLRTHATAQREIQDLARQWDAIINPLFPVSWRALTCQS